MSCGSVVAVVLTHNGGAVAIECLRSLRAADWPRLRCVLVDNASEDGTSEAVASTFDDVEIVRSATNRGYAGGNNLGFEQALSGPCDYVLVLNDDTVIEPDAIRRLVCATVDGVGAAAPLITYDTPSDLVWFAGATYDPRHAHPGRMTHYRRPVEEVGEGGTTDRFSGAAVLIPRAVIETLGGFDEGLYFLYEDVDLSLRIRATGLKIVFEPKAVVRHKVAMSQGGEHSPASFYYGIRNELLVADRYAPVSTFARRRRSMVALADFAIRLRHADHRWASMQALVSGHRDYRRGRIGPWQE